MIITKLTAKNFGKHETIAFSTSEAVVGIIGPNGSGKSTLLKLLQFLFTGMLEDNLDSYVRQGAKFCEGEAHFIKNGQPGRIYRKVFASSTPAKRELEWNGATTTRDNDVAVQLAEILGADRHAINNAVFIPQGDLDKILFGDQAEREKLFTRLVNVAFLEKTVGVLDAKIKQESIHTEDLTAVVDELRSQLAQAGGHVQDLDVEYRSKPDVTSELTYLRRLSDLMQQEAQSLSRAVAAAQAARQHDTALQAAIRSAGYTSWEELQSHDTALATELKALVEQRDLLTRQKHARELHDKTAEALLQLDGSLAEHQQRLALCNSHLLGVDLFALRERIAKATDRSNLEVALQKAKTAQSSAMAAYTEWLATTCPDDSRVLPLREEIAGLLAQSGGLDLTLTTLRSLVGRVTGDRCPCCEQTIDPALLSMARLEQLERTKAGLTQSIQQKRTEADALEKARRDWTLQSKARYDAYMASIQHCAELTARYSALPAENAKDLQAAYDTAVRWQTQRSEIDRALGTLRQQRAQLVTNLSPTPPPQIAPEGLAQVQQQLATAQEKQQKLLNLRSTVASLWQIKTKAEAEERAGQAESQRKTAELTAHRNQRPPMTVEDTFTLATKVTELEGLERLRQECAGRLQQARQNLEALQKRDLELAERLSKNEIRRQVVEDLRRLRETFSRSGLPMVYVEYQFRRLTTMAQTNLSNIGANFTVEVNPDRPVAFTFTRLDDEAGQGLDMVKLSGGQRVKLSIAFLLSVQQLLIPEVGLLVLDEPSTHLDEESVGALKQLLMGMTQTLRNAHHQVWVVDHHTDLMPAFGTCLQLG